ncbi:MAG TPA: hypothetical protein VHM31_21405 [Polyangia bacterium]|nr:hypothetical protein [Polyangia bacterium]
MRLMGFAGTMAGCALALSACHAGAGVAPTTTPALPGPMVVVERAETGPITALAGFAPSLWAVGAPGLRRWDVTSGDWEVVGDAQLAGASITALAADEDGSAWVAFSGDVGRFVADQHGDWRYQSTGSPGEVTALAARAAAKGGGAWAGGPGGLFRYDGHRWSVIDGIDGAGVSWLGIDAEGRGAWVATTGHGLFHADDRGTTPVPGGAAVRAPEIVGMATTATGTRLAGGNVAGQGRLYALTMAGTVELIAPAGVLVRGLVDRGGDAVLVAGPRGGERAFRLQPLAPGEPVPPGALRFGGSAGPGEHERWAAVPLDLALPPGVTVTAAAGGDVYCGTSDLGVAKAAAGRPVFLDGSQLVGDAEHFSVACLATDRCLVVTEPGKAWRTDGARYEKASLGDAPAAQVLGVATDSHGTAYAVSSEPPWNALVIARRDPAPHATQATGTNDSWRPAARVLIDLPPHTTPQLSFLSVSPAGTLWAGLRAASGGDDVGCGAVEVDLQTGISVQHHATRPGARTPAESLPLPADLEDVLFDGGATWFASLSGVCRFEQGQLETWGEAEGLPSELVWAVERAPDGTIVAATSEGLARFDGHAFRAFGGEKFAVHGLATDGRGTLWAATNRGLRPVPVGGGWNRALADAPEMVPGSLRDVAPDAFGRVWALTVNAIALASVSGGPAVNGSRAP